MSAVRALEEWCRCQCDGYRDVKITNMTTSFRSGLAFCALIHKHRPDLIDYNSLRMEDVFDNNKLAFRVAEEELGIPALLDAEDMVALKVPDRLSILTYVSQYYNYFKARQSRVKQSTGGSKEVPLEKKSLPVAVVKSQLVPSIIAERSSPKIDKNAVANSDAGKSGTFNSKCVACKTHVHLVQRHFVEGKLFHRSCFICCECFGTLHAGGYEPGKIPNTFVCRVHPEKSSESSSDAQLKSASELLNSFIQIQPPKPSQPVHPGPPSQCWTTSAQKTQAARQSFLQTPSASTTFPQWPKLNNNNNGRPGKSLAEENCNNNNKRLFTIRSAERRFGAQSEKCISLKVECKKTPTRDSDTCSEDSAVPEANEHGGTKPTAASDLPYERQSKTKPAESEAEAPRRQNESTSKDHCHDFMSTTFFSATTTPTAVNHPSSGHGYPVDPPRKRSHVKFPARQPAMESISEPTSNMDIPSGAKKGKYLSPTNASGTETRSPSRPPYHVSAERIERELDDIAMNLTLLEREGVELERKLRRSEEEAEGDLLMDPLMVDWFQLIRKKQMFIRKESELVYTARTQELERQQWPVEQELRRLLEKPDGVKSVEERAYEEKLMCDLVDIVNGRNAIVEVLDDERLRELAEDEELNEMMKNLGVKKSKPKRKTHISKLFARRSKRRVQ
ncbi:MICAL-like protein 2a [Stigmatopora nigra]